MIATLAALFSFVPVFAPPIEINVNAVDGEVINGDRTFKVTVKSEDLVTQVELYVGDELRESDSSTPYEFKIDSLAEPEGELVLTFSVQTSEGDSAKKTIKVKIDNDLGKGPEFHVQKALDLITSMKWDEAIRSCRVALKSKEAYNPARYALARAYFGKGVMDSAQKYAEDAIAADPNYTEARELLSVINLRRAFTTYNRGADRKETLATIASAMKQAIENRAKLVDASIAKLGTPNESNLNRISDYYIVSGQYSAAIRTLTPYFRQGVASPAIANRLAYAQIRAGRLSDAESTFSAYLRNKNVDAYGYALIAVNKHLLGQEDASDQMIKEALLTDGENLGVQTAQVWLALRGGKKAVMANLLKPLVDTLGHRSEVAYYQAALYSMQGLYSEANDAFQRAVLAEPLNLDVYVQRGIDALNQSQAPKIDPKDAESQYGLAKVFFDSALAVKPESAEALTGMACYYGLQKKFTEARKYAEAAAAAAKSYSPAYQVLASVLMEIANDTLRQATALEGQARRQDANAMTAEGNKVQKAAFDAKAMGEKLDPKVLGGLAMMPKVSEAFQYFVKRGKLPLLSPIKD